ncbi:MAG: hypothetical protein A2078_07255 [Nitrospirae bacterium GWC2_57_9]|nr:MAG: hypothetical protein A2078_07255 [Nitrospirae bacterium GWC2_57_9]
MRKTFAQADRTVRTFMLLIGLLAAVTLAPAGARAAEPFAARITVIDSGSSPAVVNIVRPGKSDFAEARIGDAVYTGDTVKTGPDVRAQVEMPDKSVVNLGPGSVLRVKASVVNPAQAKRNYVFKAFKGTIRFIIAKVLSGKNGATTPWRDSSVVVETTTAVAGVRGTDFITITDTSKAVPDVEIAVLEGLVSVRNISLPVNGAITVSADQITRISRGASPTAPSPLSPERRNSLVQSSSPRVTNGPAGSGGQQGKSKKKGGYGRSDVARDLAAGLPLAQVLDRAVEKGMTIGMAVDAAVEAGATPYDVVYTAITEGFPVTLVVEAAIKSGAPLQEVVSAAIMGGAEIRAVITGAQMAAAPADAVATAVASATTATSPIFGYQPPSSTPAGTAAIPQPVPVIGGGGGATPKTLPASPYRP